jgi:hypothetical protein
MWGENVSEADGCKSMDQQLSLDPPTGFRGEDFLIV